MSVEAIKERCCRQNHLAIKHLDSLLSVELVDRFIQDSDLFQQTAQSYNEKTSRLEEMEREANGSIWSPLTSVCCYCFGKEAERDSLRIEVRQLQNRVADLYYQKLGRFVQIIDASPDHLFHVAGRFQIPLTRELTREKHHAIQNILTGKRILTERAALQSLIGEQQNILKKYEYIQLSLEKGNREIGEMARKLGVDPDAPFDEIEALIRDQQEALSNPGYKEALDLPLLPSDSPPSPPPETAIFHPNSQRESE